MKTVDTSRVQKKGPERAKIAPEEIDFKGVKIAKSPPPPRRLKKSQPTSQSTNQSTDRSTDQLTGRPTPATEPIVDRPKAFYITQKVNDWVNEAVEHFQKKEGLKKADRSTIVNAILHDHEIWSEEGLKKLKGRVIKQLTNRSISR